MTGAECLIQTCKQYGAADLFGVPGGVVLELLYAAERCGGMTAHLNYHEQASGFAALGYAQLRQTLGVVYATRGPGFTNLLTPMAESYQESLPVLFLTAHTCRETNAQMRMVMDQEMDTLSVVQSLTKYAARIDEAADIAPQVERACSVALAGRKGPVFLDIATHLLQMEIPPQVHKKSEAAQVEMSCARAACQAVARAINQAKRPVLLLGAGAAQARDHAVLHKLVREHHIPVLTSRGTQDLLVETGGNFGYIGSHGLRYSNFILSKADLIVALGNRMAFPLQSASYRPLFEKIKTIRIDVDSQELSREIPNAESFSIDLDAFLNEWDDNALRPRSEDWWKTCTELWKTLENCDTEEPVPTLADFLRQIPSEIPLVVDVGNNEFWVSRAYAFARAKHRILYSRSFGTLGCALPKAIGVHHRTKRPTVCLAGDQGFQFNVQELQTLAMERLPILVAVCNNHASGMIRDREIQRYNGRCLHTTGQSGYGTPDFAALAKAYGLEAAKWETFAVNEWVCDPKPMLLEIPIPDNAILHPSLPKGAPCQDMEPLLERDLYKKLECW